MRKTISRFCLSIAVAAVLLFTGAVPAFSENISDAWTDRLFQSVKAVSGQVFIVRGSQPVYVHSYGWRDARKTKPVSADTKYAIASVMAKRMIIISTTYSMLAFRNVITSPAGWLTLTTMPK